MEKLRLDVAESMNQIQEISINLIGKESKLQVRELKVIFSSNSLFLSRSLLFTSCLLLRIHKFLSILKILVS